MMVLEVISEVEPRVKIHISATAIVKTAWGKVSLIISWYVFQAILAPLNKFCTQQIFLFNVLGFSACQLLIFR